MDFTATGIPQILWDPFRLPSACVRVNCTEVTKGGRMLRDTHCRSENAVLLISIVDSSVVEDAWHAELVRANRRRRGFMREHAIGTQARQRTELSREASPGRAKRLARRLQRKPSRHPRTTIRSRQSGLQKFCSGSISFIRT